jgi:hypothetical protein
MSFLLMVLQHAADLLLDLDRESGQISRPRMTAISAGHYDEQAADVLTRWALNRERLIGIGHAGTATLAHQYT